MSLRERTRPGLGIIEPCLPSPRDAVCRPLSPIGPRVPRCQTKARQPFVRERKTTQDSHLVIMATLQRTQWDESVGFATASARASIQIERDGPRGKTLCLL